MYNYAKLRLKAWLYDGHHMRIWWHWHVARIISSQKILYGLKHHIAEISGDVTDAGQTIEQRQTREDRATQPMEAGGWVSQNLNQPLRLRRNFNCFTPWYFRPVFCLKFIFNVTIPISPPPPHFLSNFSELNNQKLNSNFYTYHLPPFKDVLS